MAYPAVSTDPNHRRASEVAADVSSAIQQAMQDGGLAQVESLLPELYAAPAPEPLDALAFASIARKLVGSAMQSAYALERRDDATFLANIFLLVDRTVKSLEGTTGFAADGFTGDFPMKPSAN